jgi:hypothetical protein
MNGFAECGYDSPGATRIRKMNEACFVLLIAGVAHAHAAE